MRKTVYTILRGVRVGQVFNLSSVENLSYGANTSQPLSAGGGNAAPHFAQVSLSRGTTCPQAGHFSRTGQQR